MWEANEILTNVYLGNVDSANNLQELTRRNITSILDFSGGGIISRHNTIHYCIFDKIEDDISQNIIGLLPIALAFISFTLKNSRRILVNCMAGVSRSSTVIIAYLIHYYNMSPVQAYQFVKQKRYIVRPNEGFWQQLVHFSKMDKQEIQEKIDKNYMAFVLGINHKWEKIL